MHLQRRVEKYLQRTGLPPSAFGRLFMGDPRFVFDLRSGREPRPATVSRLCSLIDALEADLG